MIRQLDRWNFERVRSLTEEVAIACAAEAALDGPCPGTVWVDGAIAPITALVDTPEGYYLVGDPGKAVFSQAAAERTLAWTRPGRGERW